MRNDRGGRGGGRGPRGGGGRHRGGNRPQRPGRPPHQRHQRWAPQREMTERDFYHETQETKTARYTCPHCREENDYPVRWLRRTKKDKLPPGATAEDREKFLRARSYMTRVDELVACRNLRCRKRFDIPTQQSVILLD